MKTFRLILLIACLPLILTGQSHFSPDAFLQHKQTTRNFTAADLLSKYPPKDTWYSSRLNPVSLTAFNYFDSINKKLELTAYERELLADNQFMVTERFQEFSFASALARIFEKDLPLFLTTDLFLHALHASYDDMLMYLEYKILEPNLLDMLTGMRNAIPSLINKYAENPELITSVKDADLFLSVAISLLKEETVRPLYENSGKYDELIPAIYAAQGITETPLFCDHTRKIDMSQFKPRGHYTEPLYFYGSPQTLEKYFRAMIWLGRIDMMLTAPPVGPGEQQWTAQELKRMAITSMLLNELLKAGGKEKNLDLHEQIITFFVGESDNLTPAELNDITIELGITPAGLSNPETYAGFLEKIQSSDDYGQKIMSDFFIVDGDPRTASLPVSFRLLGQKFILDSYIFSQVVYDRIVFNDVKVLRMMPDPLDILAALGNESALALLEDEMETWHYAPQMENLKYLVESYDESYWKSTLYTSWLKAIRTLNPGKVPAGAPWFMNTTEWQHQKMNTQLASWAELRHDNILYAKQSYTGGTSCSFPHVYVEPNPALFLGLFEFAGLAAGFFDKTAGDYPNADINLISQFWEDFGNHMYKLAVLAEKELAGEVFTDSDMAYLKSFFSMTFMCGITIDGWFLDIFFNPFRAEEDDFIIADVHTQPTDEYGNVVGKVLHAATGRINLGVFLAPAPSNNYSLTAFAGPCMSFHSVVKNDFYRMNDEEWSALMKEEKPLNYRPDWVNVYLAGTEGQYRGEGRSLKGALFTGLDPVPGGTTAGIGYAFIYPNPATDQSMLMFTLNEEKLIEIELFDARGVKIRTIAKQLLPATEHVFPVEAGNLKPGMYFLRISVQGEGQKMVKMIR